MKKHTDATRAARQLAKRLRRAAHIADDAALMGEMNKMSDDMVHESIHVALHTVSEAGR